MDALITCFVASFGIVFGALSALGVFLGLAMALPKIAGYLLRGARR